MICLILLFMINIVKAEKSEMLKYSKNSNLLELTGSCGPNLNYNIEDGTLSITGSGYMTNYSFINDDKTPWFSQSGSITKIIIGPDVCSIGSNAFYKLANVISITFPDSVTLIGSYALQFCSSLAIIELSKNIVTIEEEAFSYTAITSFTLPETFTSVPKGLFVGCSDLATVNLHEKIEIIEKEAFYKCASLQSIELPENLIDMCTSAFCQAGLISIEIPKNIVNISEGLFDTCHNLNSVVFLGNKVERIITFAFCECLSLKTIELPKSLVYIDERTFIASGLISITIPEKVTTIPEIVFESCSFLTTVNFLSNIETFYTDAFLDCNALESITFFGEVDTFDLFDESLNLNLNVVNYFGSTNPTVKNNAFNTINIDKVFVTRKYLDNNWCGYNIEVVLSDTFTPSNAFSLSNAFTLSNEFTLSDAFSLSNSFSQSDAFSLSNSFTSSNVFSLSNAFSLSNEFTSSDAFSLSNSFSQSDAFSLSNSFTSSNAFSLSNEFTSSNSFSLSNEFTSSNAFSLSNEFTSSNEFSLSNEFTSSNEFSLSNKFKSSNEFSLSNKFSESGKFSKSQMFSLSKEFTLSNKFSESDTFTNSDLLPSIRFSSSEQFSSSKKFTKSNEFSISDHFTKSEEFSLSDLLPAFVNDEKQQTSMVLTSLSSSFTISFVSVRSVSFVLSYVVSNTYMMSYFENKNSFSLIITQKKVFY